MYSKSIPPAATKVVAPRIAISSSVSRQSTAKPGQATAMRSTPDRAQGPQPVFGVGPRASARRPRVTGTRPTSAPRAQRELSGDEPRRRKALRAVGIAAVRVALRDAVEGEQQVIEGRACRADARRERLDVAGLGVVVLDHEPRRAAWASARAPRPRDRARPRSWSPNTAGRAAARRSASRPPSATACKRAVDGGVAVGHAHRDGGRLRLQRS